MMPCSASIFWWVVPTDALSNTASTATPVSRSCSRSLNAQPLECTHQNRVHLAGLIDRRAMDLGAEK